MLSLAKCREILGDDCPHSDAEMEMLRNQLYAVAGAVVEACSDKRHKKKSQDMHAAAGETMKTVGAGPEPPKQTAFADTLALLPEADRYEIEERAGIIESDSGLDREAAERAALSLYWRARHTEN